MDALSNNTSLNQTHLLQSQSARLEDLKQSYLHPEGADKQKLKKAAQEFEAIFVQQLLDAMDQTVDRQDSLLGGGNAEAYFRGMMNEEIAKSLSTRPGGSGFGLAESIYRQMEKQLEQGEVQR